MSTRWFAEPVVLRVAPRCPPLGLGTKMSVTLRISAAAPVTCRADLLAGRLCIPVRGSVGSRKATELSL